MRMDANKELVGRDPSIALFQANEIERKMQLFDLFAQKIYMAILENTIYKSESTALDVHLKFIQEYEENFPDSSKDVRRFLDKKYKRPDTSKTWLRGFLNRRNLNR